jgi:hypothetical protein
MVEMTDVDDDLIDELRRLVGQVDPVPRQVREAARLALATRHLDGALAELVADSAAMDGGAGFQPVRSAVTGDRVLLFEGGGVRVDAEVVPDGERFTLYGQFAAGPAECALEFPDGRRQRVEVDELGRFLVGGVPAGPVRLRSAGAAEVVTSWVSL